MIQIRLPSVTILSGGLIKCEEGVADAFFSEDIHQDDAFT